MSPPIEVDGEERDAINLSFINVVRGQPKTLVTVEFMKTKECVLCGDKLINVYKEVSVTRSTSTE